MLKIVTICIIILLKLTELERINVKSFGMWYIPKVNQNVDIDLHINIWNIENASAEYRDPFIEFGFKISNFETIKKIILFLPFKINDDYNDPKIIKDEYIDDLTQGAINVKTAPLIFNDNCAVASMYIKGTTFSTLNFKDDFGNDCERYLLIGKEYFEINLIDDYNMITIDLEKFITGSLHGDKNAYIRFRIRSKNFKKNLFSNLKPKNYFLESAFSCTQIMDIKINKIRNIPEGILKKAIEDKWHPLKFNNIHFLVMEPAERDITINGNDFVECRNIESEWKEYFKKGDSYVVNDLTDILAYHWKIKGKEQKTNDLNGDPTINKTYIEDYSKLVKITYAKKNWKIILSYIGATIFMGAFGSGLFEFIKSLIFTC